MADNACIAHCRSEGHTSQPHEARQVDDDACVDRVVDCWRLQRGIHTAQAQQTWSPPHDLTLIVNCHEPILVEIASCLTARPKDMVNFCHLLAASVAAQFEFAQKSLWREMYTQRWPAFGACMHFRGAQDWRSLYQKTLRGWWECTLEVFEREKKLGFVMSALPARVQYDASTNRYIARYLSASESLPECIPVGEGHRLRFCPPSARLRLHPGLAFLGDAGDAKIDIDIPKHACSEVEYPYHVLKGIDGLSVGQGVELQWKMQYCSPFGWWYGCLNELRPIADSVAHATITFRHFPKDSRWYKLEVSFGDDEIRPCTFGGYTGGIRGASVAEQREWMQFFPKEPIVNR